MIMYVYIYILYIWIYIYTFICVYIYILYLTRSIVVADQNLKHCVGVFMQLSVGPPILAWNHWTQDVSLRRSPKTTWPSSRPEGLRQRWWHTGACTIITQQRPLERRKPSSVMLVGCSWGLVLQSRSYESKVFYVDLFWLTLLKNRLHWCASITHHPYDLSASSDFGFLMIVWINQY